jgi:DNA anti-recombination protein RmuC
MLLTRVQRIAKNEHNFSKYHQSIIEHFEKVETTLVDSVERYDRLMSLSDRLTKTKLKKIGREVLSLVLEVPVFAN